MIDPAFVHLRLHSEYSIADGTVRIDDAVRRILALFDRFLGRLISDLPRPGWLLALTSDHGNIEDARTRLHTTNPVPVIVLGPILVWIFGVSLKWLPPTGWGSQPPYVLGLFPSNLGPEFFKYAIMPSVALGLVSSASIARLTRSVSFRHLNNC